MTRLAVYGVAPGLDGRDAAMKATQQALDQLGALKPVLAVALVSEEFDANDTLNGLVSLLGDTPIWGISSVRVLSGDSEKPRSTVVALLAGSDIKAQVQWIPSFGSDSPEAARQLARALRQELLLPQAILLAADGVAGSLAPVCSALAEIPVPTGGMMASGSHSSGRTALFGKAMAGAGALSAALLSGRFRVGSGSGHGWRDTGLYYTVTRSNDIWVQTLDGQPVAEIYGRVFNREAREWSFPPLNELVRLYPLGIEMPQQPGELVIRSPLRFEIGGRLRMSAPVPEGAVAHLMLGDPASCLSAAETAVRQALANLGEARPLLALASIDLAWQALFENHPNQVAQVLQESLGSIPLVGAYTLGQVVRATLNEAPAIYNQGVTVQIIGCAE